MQRRKRRGATLFEVIITTGLFSIMVIITFKILRDGLRSWSNIEGRHDAQKQLRRVELLLTEDLKSASFKNLNRGSYIPTGSPNGVGTDGDAVWFLSAVVPDKNPTSGVLYGNFAGQVAREPLTSALVWQTNVIYYMTIAGNHPAGGFVSDGTGPPAGEGSCPHKLLIRKIVDVVDQTGNPVNIATAETLIPAGSITSYLRAPATPGDLTNVIAAGGKTIDGGVQVIATQLLSFRVTLGTPEPTVTFTTRALRIREAQKVVGYDNGVNLINSDFTIQYKATVVPGSP